MPEGGAGLEKALGGVEGLECVAGGHHVAVAVAAG